MSSLSQIRSQDSKKEDALFIGIDFSINSPGVCLIKNNHIKWISVYSVDEQDHHKLLTKKDGPFKILDESKSITVSLRDKKDQTGKNYSETERNKLNLFINLSDDIIRCIKKAVGGFTGDNVYVAIEGISFGSKGNTLMDLCMATGILRTQLLSEVLSGESDRFFVFSPGTIKKHAIKGNAEKKDLYDSLLKNEYLKENEFIKILNMFKDSWVTSSGIIKKPIDDLVDSTWIALLLKDTVLGLKDENLIEKKASKKKKLSKKQPSKI